MLVVVSPHWKHMRDTLLIVLIFQDNRPKNQQRNVLTLTMRTQDLHPLARLFTPHCLLQMKANLPTLGG